MPLNKTALAQSILKLMTDARKETEIDDSKSANGLADAIDAFVKTGEVQAGIPVSTLVLLLLRQVLRLVQEKYCNDLLYL